ncbi:uncharacterized protein LOC126668545 [Mercurialis annua]|uniref:uncharacterized protein LOC126668545 n=1 Tax=Mercurialis annua TaxID=3986 RepID=UPI00215FFE18|nr:uncharacterized protein LOC126668545 [Mercurialis annua]
MEWDALKIKRLFIDEDTTAILSIPLLIYLSQDRVIWHHNKDGIYTVKSGYHLVINEKKERLQPNHNASWNHRVLVDWKWLWEMKLPNKLKVFFWKLLWNGLPTGEELNKRLNTSHLCPHCNQIENNLHLFFKFHFAERVWFASPLSIRSNNIQGEQFKEVWEVLIANLKEVDSSGKCTQLFMFLMWAIWKARNFKVFKEKEWLEINVPSMRLGQIRRKACPNHCIRINYDGAINVAYKFGTVAFVARNNNGTILDSKAAVFRGIWDLGVMEFLDLLEAMRWSIQKGWQSVFFEGDAVRITQSANSGFCYLATGWGICQDIWRLKHSLKETHFGWIERKSNREAHKEATEEKKIFLR